MNAIGTAALAALVYGAGDFFGGVASRRLGSFTVVACAQAIGLVGVLALLAVRPEAPTLAAIGWGLATGVAAALGIGALYAGLAAGSMGVVSPISAVIGASLPVLVRVVAGERLHARALLGCGCALVAVVAASVAPAGARRGAVRSWLPLAVASGVGFASFYLALAHARPQTLFTTIAAARATSASIFALLLAIRRRSRREALRSQAPPARADLGLLLLAGACDTAANVLYAQAAHGGSLALAVVVTSLYPASTVVLACIFLRERLGRTQWAGVGCAIAGAMLIAAG